MLGFYSIHSSDHAHNLLGSVVKGRFQTDGGEFVKDACITDVHVDDGLVTIRLDSEKHASFWMQISFDEKKLLALLQQ